MGWSEDIITALSRIRWLFVIARNSSFTYKGRTIDIRQIGRELGASCVLEGSLRTIGKRTRVTAQLIETETGRHIWAESYDRDLLDIFTMQDEITEAVTIAIAPVIADVEQRGPSAGRRKALRLGGAYQRGLWHFGQRSPL